MELPRLKGRVGLKEYRACPKVPGEPDWETNELEGFEDVNLHYEGKLITTKLYTQGIAKSSKDEKLHKLQRCYDLLAHLRERTRTILSEITDEKILRCVRAFQQDIESKRFHDNPTVGYLRDSDATRVAFVRQGLQLFVRTNHTLQELDPRESYFRAVNKPHAPIRPLARP